MPATSTDLPGRFADYATADLAAQCRMQARENLDPEYSQFMTAVADRLTTFEPDSQAEWELEQAAFAHANDPKVPINARITIQALWAAFVAREPATDNALEMETPLAHR